MNSANSPLTGKQLTDYHRNELKSRGFLLLLVLLH